MRKTLFSSLLLFLTCAGFCQLTQVKIDQYMMPLPTPAEDLIIVEMPFAKSNLISIKGDTSSLKHAGDIIIDVVFTDYPSGALLRELNSRRIEEFFILFPYISPERIQTTTYLRQLNGSNEEKAKPMFHGLIIRFRKKQTTEIMKQDLSRLDMILTPIENKPATTATPPGNIKTKTNTSLQASDTLVTSITQGQKGTGKKTTITVKKRKWCGMTANIVPDIKKRDMRFFKKADSVSIVTPLVAFKEGIIDKAMYKAYKDEYLITLYFCPDGYTPATGQNTIDLIDETQDFTSVPGRKAGSLFRLPDSTVFNVLTRNKWKNMDIVGDVTGSMYPYTAQLLVWLKLRSLDSLSRHFVFFNDGDNKPDRQKQLGRTGGIYSRNCNSFEEVKNLVNTAMMKGSGGDGPENNIEALLAAEKAFPQNTFHVMIADNWAPIKDKVLTKQLTKPVRIVLCGVHDGDVHPDYLNLARSTKGSLHLIEEDLFQLAAMHEGDELKIGKRTFKIVDGEFKEVFFTEAQSL